MKIIPSYHPPSDYRRPTKTQEKVYVPVNDYPEINFSMPSNPLILPSALAQVVFLHILSTTIKSRTNPPANFVDCTFNQTITNT